ncbi:hypothetical protein ACROYT_G016391 [Oculina patagonica]
MTSLPLCFIVSVSALLFKSFLPVQGSPVQGNCFSNDLGVSSPYIIGYGRMTASSYKDSGHHPSRGRLDYFNNGWCTKTSSKSDEWLQVDLGKLHQVCGVATQGGEVNGKGAWVKEFKLSYSQEGKQWLTYLDRNGKEMGKQSRGAVSEIGDAGLTRVAEFPQRVADTERDK